MIKSLKKIVIILAFLIFTLTIFILFTLYSRFNQKPINDLLTENNSILLIEDEYDLKELDIEKGFFISSLEKKR